MKKINKLLRQMLFVLLTFLSIVSYSQIYFNPADHNFGDVWGGDDLTCEYTVISNSSSPITCTVHIDEVLEDIPWISTIYPEYFSFNSEGEAAYVEISGTISTSFPTEINTFAINYYDFDYPYSLIGTFNISFDFQGYPGIEDRVEISIGDYSFSEGDFLGYEGTFIDEDPYGDEVDEWNLKMELFTDEENYTYVDITNTEGYWNFFAPEIPENMTFHRNDQGQILGVLTLAGHDTDGYLHFATEYFGINKEPDEPILYIQPDDGTIDVHISNSGGTTNYLYYGVNAGDPYSGTGLNQGNSPINMGDNENITIDGFQNCSKYFFAVKSYNQFGTSDYSNEKSVRIFSPENALPVQYHLSNCTIDNEHEFEGNHYFNGDLIIETGAILNVVDGVMYFEEDSKIIIEPGGQLILDGATCTAPCGQTWNGIQVWGNSSQSQVPLPGSDCAQGKLVLTNDAIIENAIIAVDLWKPNDYSKTGGIVIADDAHFINNARALRALHYDNFHPFDITIIWDNLSHFNNCVFDINTNYVGAETFYKHIDLSNVKGFSFKGCDFTNTTTNNVSEYNCGIMANDAGFSVEEYCFYQPCSNGDESNLSGFYSAVWAANTPGTTNTFLVSNANFANNAIGVKVNAVNNAAIISSTFDLGYNQNLFSKEECRDRAISYGIDMTYSHSFAIEDNTFTTSQTTGEYIGVRVLESNSPLDLIYNNMFTGLNEANRAEGDNRYGTNDAHGLEYQCNHNINNDIDFIVTAALPIDAEIKTSMGSMTLASGNTFTDDVNAMHFINTGLRTINYFWCDLSACVLQEPLYYSTITNFIPIDISLSNSCPPHYGGGGIEIKLSEAEVLLKESEFTESLNNYNSVLSLYESLEDGGNTTGELLDITTAQPADTWELRAQLLGHSPYLSSLVLKEASNKTNVLPEAILFEILSANPDELRNPELIAHLENKEQPLPEYMISILQQIAGGITAKTVLKMEMAEYHSSKSIAAYDIIRSILNDSIRNNDNLRGWLSNLQSYNADKQIISSWLQEGNTTDAQSLLNILPSLYELQNDELQAYNDYNQLVGIQINLINQQRNTTQLNSSEIVELTDLAENGKGVARRNARNILEYAYGYHYHDCPCDDTETAKTVNATLPIKILENVLQIEVFPSPASTWVTFDYRLPLNEKEAYITISDVNGKTINRIELSGNRGQKVIDVRKMTNGIWFYTLHAGSLTKSGKLIIQH